VVKDLGYGLVVWDTLARMIPGIEENSAKEVGLVVQALDRLRVQAHCASLVLHHSVKGGNGARGVSAFLGACDTELHLAAQDQLLTLKVEQQRDWKRRDELKLWLHPVPGVESASVVEYRGQVVLSRPPVEQKILDEMAKATAQPWSTAEICGMTSLPRQTLQPYLVKLEIEGRLLKARVGNGHTYTLVKQGVSP
jgi:hypothetical protein